MEQHGVQFYKLNKSKRYKAEGTCFKIGEAILLGVVLAVFLAAAVALIVVNFSVLFRDVGITVATLLIWAVLAVIIVVACLTYFPIFKRINRARKILKNCTLTVGTVIDVVKQKKWRNGVNTATNYSYYLVVLKYEFHGLDGEIRYGNYSGKYFDVLFYLGQNLMIAFDDKDSVIMSEFELSDGAQEFTAAEEERARVDFSGLSGKLIKVDRSKPIKIANYTYNASRKHKKRLKQILSGNPLFTVGKYFICKSTYRYNSNNQCFCYVTATGRQRVEECSGIRNLSDGDEVVVAYDCGVAEIVSLKK